MVMADISVCAEPSTPCSETGFSFFPADRFLKVAWEVFYFTCSSPSRQPSLSYLDNVKVMPTFCRTHLRTKMRVKRSLKHPD